MLKRPMICGRFRWQKKGRIQPTLFLLMGMPLLAPWTVAFSLLTWQAGCADLSLLCLVGNYH